METEVPPQPREPILIPGVHGTRAEIRFVNDVVHDEIQPRYDGPIQLIGSRADPVPSRISKVNWASYCYTHHIEDAVAEEWFKWLNDQVKKRKLSRARIPLLVDHIPRGTPEFVQDYLERTGGEAGSDFDLLMQVEKRPSGVLQVYHDTRYKTGQTVEVFTLRDLEAFESMNQPERSNRSIRSSS